MNLKENMKVGRIHDQLNAQTLYESKLCKFPCLQNITRLSTVFTRDKFAPKPSTGCYLTCNKQAAILPAINFCNPGSVDKQLTEELNDLGYNMTLKDGYMSIVTSVSNLRGFAEAEGSSQIPYFTQI